VRGNAARLGNRIISTGVKAKKRAEKTLNKVAQRRRQFEVTTTPGHIVPQMEHGRCVRIDRACHRTSPLHEGQ